MDDGYGERLTFHKLRIVTDHKSVQKLWLLPHLSVFHTKNKVSERRDININIDIIEMFLCSFLICPRLTSVEIGREDGMEKRQALRLKQPYAQCNKKSPFEFSKGINNHL